MSVVTTAFAPDHTVMPDGDMPDGNHAAAEINAIFDRRELVQLIAPRNAEGGVLADMHIVADSLGMQDHPAVMPDPHATTEDHRVRQCDAACPLDPFLKEAIKQGAGHPKQLRQTHSPVAEAMRGDGPEALLEELAIVGFEIFAEQVDESNAGRIYVSAAGIDRLCRRGGSRARGSFSRHGKWRCGHLGTRSSCCARARVDVGHIRYAGNDRRGRSLWLCLHGDPTGIDRRDKAHARHRANGQ